MNLSRIQLRYRLVLLGVLICALTLISASITYNAYSVAYSLFENIAVFYAPKVDSSENALAYLARTSQAMADYTALSSDTPLFEQSVNNIFRNFDLYRDELFILETNLQTEEEEAAFLVADTYTYNRFWRHVGNLIDGRSDEDLARREYLAADNNLRNRIVPALEDLEAINFNLMLNAGENAENTINGQIFYVALSGIALAIILTVASFWLRRKVRRYLSPALDLAMLLGWIVPLLILQNLASLPAQINEMTGSAYNSISGSSRVLVSGNLANRAESSAIIDSSRADYWFEQFDSNYQDLELQLCGIADCASQSFLNTNGSISATVLANAQSAEFDTLLQNANYEGEVQALENARIALQDYLSIHGLLRGYIEVGELDSALELNTSQEAGNSEEAFLRFSSEIETVQMINRSVFDAIWREQSSRLPFNRMIYAILTSITVIVLTIFGINQRFREL